MEFNFDEDGSEDIRRRSCVYILVENDALAAQISVVTFLAFVARNLVILEISIRQSQNSL
jgi:hypothetical protein